MNTSKGKVLHLLANTSNRIDTLRPEIKWPQVRKRHFQTHFLKAVFCFRYITAFHCHHYQDNSHGLNVCRVSCGGVFNMLLVLSITFYFHYNIWSCMCSTGPFQYRWLKGYIYSLNLNLNLKIVYSTRKKIQTWHNITQSTWQYVFCCRETLTKALSAPLA